MSENSQQNQPRVTVDKRNFLRVGGVKVGRVTPEGRVQFCDKDRKRSAERGTRYVEVDIDRIKTAVDRARKRNDGG